jgi:hypothetical protein
MSNTAEVIYDGFLSNVERALEKKSTLNLVYR